MSGDWLIYSYEDQGFSWLRPHLYEGLFSYKSGWLTYSPLMVFSLIGFYALYRYKPSIFAACLIFSLLFIYITFAWDEWTYGGALGQRAMVQAYAVLAFPLAAFFRALMGFKTVLQIILCALLALFVTMNLWFTRQAHQGGMLHAGFMNKAYYC